MTDAEYLATLNSLPVQVLNGTYVVDWHSVIGNCPPDPMSCNWVKGYNPINNCWIDPGMQYVTRPNPYPAASSWGVSLCNPPIVTGGGTTGSGGSGSGGGTTSGGSGNFQCPAGTVMSDGKCVATSANPLPGLNMTYVLLAIGGLGLLLMLRK